jgi:hypothetical protein
MAGDERLECIISQNFQMGLYPTISGLYDLLPETETDGFFF